MCEFCIELSGNAVDAFDRWLHWDTNLAIGPSIGHFTPGYLLFVPLEHRSSFARLSSPTLRNAADYLTFTRLLVSDLYGPPIVAEHGSCGLSRPGVACCEHAHLHLIPMPDERHCDEVRAEYIARDAHYVELSSLNDLAKWGDDPYLYLSVRPGEHLLWPLSSSNETLFPSQFVRRVCSEILGVKEWDWRLDPFIEEAVQTRKRLGEAFAASHGIYRPRVLSELESTRQAERAIGVPSAPRLNGSDPR
jgi:diadenosine tetraphosphate (Ap4A) HIT family hydrolase